MLEILSSYLEDCTQVVRVGTSKSTKLTVTSGASEDSSRGLLLFCMFIILHFCRLPKNLGSEQDPA